MEKLKLNLNERVKFSIALKLGLLLASFAILASGWTGYYTYHSTREILTREATQDILQSSQVVGRRFSIMALSAANDARFLAQTRLAIQSFDSGNATKNSRKILANQFKNLLLVHPEYFQIRFISAQDYGIELVRVDREINRIDVIKGLNLQEKQQYPYVYETLKLAIGKVYFSKIFINHEEGAHAGHKQPTLQVAAPVINQAGVKLGVIVINIDLKQMFAMLKTNLSPKDQLYLTNQAGDYLIHPDRAMTFGFDKGRRFLVQHTFKAVSMIVDETANTATVHTTEQPIDVIGGFTRISFGSSKKHRFVIIGLTVPLKFVLADTDTLAKNTQRIVIAFSLLAILLSSFMAILFVRPLKHLLLAVQRFSNTKELTPVTLDNKDELGMLASNINLMQAHILTHLNDINQQNKVLNKEITERVQIEQFERFRNHILELLTGTASLTEILIAIVRGVEVLKPDMRCSILQLSKDGQHLASGIAPSLPDFYNAAINGIKICPGMASCGTAAFTGERVITEDIQNQANWEPYKDLAAQAKLGSCWSQPILSSSAQILVSCHASNVG